MIEVPSRSEHPDAGELNHLAYKLGVELFKATNFPAAAQLFVEALEYWPEDSQAWFALGNCYDELLKPKKAEQCFRTALEHSPAEKLPGVYYNLANSLYDQSRFAEAIALYSKIPDGHPVHGKAQRNSIQAGRLTEEQAELAIGDQRAARRG